MRRPTAWLGLLALLVAGCATHPPYGHFAASPAAVDEVMAADAVKQLTALYPPAKTRLTLAQPTPDLFGRALVKGLRQQGYALRELAPQGAKTAPHAESGLALAYVLDDTESLSLYRLTLHIGSQALSRGYRLENGTGVPASAWTRRE
jgi:hypothetical protein